MIDQEKWKWRSARSSRSCNRRPDPLQHLAVVDTLVVQTVLVSCMSSNAVASCSDPRSDRKRRHISVEANHSTRRRTREIALIRRSTLILRRCAEDIGPRRATNHWRANRHLFHRSHRNRSQRSQDASQNSPRLFQSPPMPTQVASQGKR